jgi:glycosyltransferase involved in cell wall biosynthesis
VKFTVVAPCSPLPLEGGVGIRLGSTLDALQSEHEFRMIVVAAEHSEAPVNPAEGTEARRTAIVRVPPQAAASGPVRLASSAIRLLRPTSFLAFPHASKALRKDLLSALALPAEAVLLYYPYPYMNALAPILSRLRQQAGRLVVDLVDVISGTWQEALRLDVSLRSVERLVRTAEIWKLRRVERRLARLADLTIVSSAREATKGRHLGARRLTTLPNTIDTGHWRRRETLTPGARPVLLVTGDFRQGTNVDAARHFLQQIWPRIRAARPDSRVWLVGRRPTRGVESSLEGPATQFFWDVPDSRPYFEEATVSLAPIVHGGGTPYKILEALAMACPVVATPEALRGFGSPPPEGVLLAKDSEQFARLTLRLITSPAERSDLARRGREEVVRRYSRAVAREFWRRGNRGDTEGLDLCVYSI